ncbi:hypothetical protein Ahy_A04g019945 [Arachis hypogaea]|uniref:Uncharacterized protein n=1 Tax=Arachis hypogaea TaxID=3818 RepID=A0A445DGT7_ARAHY|nr:hypothetical protein Ahy_A04g019945 [Arachis hypogaea]
MEEFSLCCASTTFAKKMAMNFPFSSLEHVISVVRDISFRKVIVRCWLEAISGQSYSNQYLKMANKMHFTNNHIIELDIASKEKMKYIELHITEIFLRNMPKLSIRKMIVVCILIFSVLTEYSSEIVDDSLDGTKTDSEDHLDGISSVGINIFKQINLNKVPKKIIKL